MSDFAAASPNGGATCRTAAVRLGVPGVTYMQSVVVIDRVDVPRGCLVDSTRSVQTVVANVAGAPNAAQPATPADKTDASEFQLVCVESSQRLHETPASTA